jgi:hypothetical protein
VASSFTKPARSSTRADATLSTAITPRPLDHRAHRFARDAAPLHRILDRIADFYRAAQRTEPDVADELATKLDAEHEWPNCRIERLCCEVDQSRDDRRRMGFVAIDLIRNPSPHAGFSAHREELRDVRDHQRS